MKPISLPNCSHILTIGKPVCLFFFTVAGLLAGEWNAGVAKVKITPSGPILMAGYASRNHPSEGVLQDLWAKALAIEDTRQHRVVFVTTDLIGLPSAITDAVSARALKKWGLTRSQLLFNASHTHSGPVVFPALNSMFDMPDAQAQTVRDYAASLREALFTVIGNAIEDMVPADISYHSTATASFAVNRRESSGGKVKIGVNPHGPVDHSAPVLRVLASSNGAPKATLFGYACHNTTLTGEFYQIAGDYAGYAQQALETAEPGSIALFLALAGGDQNPNPRSTLELAKVHGEALATAVRQTANRAGLRVEGRLRSAFQVTELPLAPHTRADFEKELEDKNPARVRRAKLMLQAYDERRPVTRVPYAAQAIRLGDTVTYLALAGEVVIDYNRMVKAKVPNARIVVAGYSNGIPAYIPSRRVLVEGGYEAVDSMIYYGLPGPFAPEVEDRVMEAAGSVLRRVNAW